MSKIVDYQVVQEVYVEDLEKLILAEMKDGWQPIGGASINQDYIFQTLVLYEDEINE